MTHTLTQDEAEAIRAYLGPLVTGEACAPIVRQIPVPLLDHVWPHVCDWIAERVVARSKGRFSLQGIAGKLLRGEWQLWVVWDGAYRAVLATELSAEGVARINFATGRGADDWAHLIGDIEQWAKEQGAHCLEMLARKGWARHMKSYRVSHVLLEKDLRDGQ